MYLSSKPNRLSTTAKSRLNHSHKLDNIEPKKRSPDEGPPLPSSEVIVFNTTNHTGNTRNNHVPRSAPEVPQANEIHRYFRESWERRMQEIKTQNLSVLWIQSDRDDNRDGPHGSHHNAPKGKNSPQHQHSHRK